ncbi:MAG: hypothetical protein ACRQFF_01510 [Sphaerochaeta sp.]
MNYKKLLVTSILAMLLIASMVSCESTSGLESTVISQKENVSTNDSQDYGPSSKYTQSDDSSSSNTVSDSLITYTREPGVPED